MAEGGGLLNRYTPLRRIEGSNPLRLRHDILKSHGNLTLMVCGPSFGPYCCASTWGLVASSTPGSVSPRAASRTPRTPPSTAPRTGLFDARVHHPQRDRRTGLVGTGVNTELPHRPRTLLEMQEPVFPAAAGSTPAAQSRFRWFSWSALRIFVWSMVVHQSARSRSGRAQW